MSRAISTEDLSREAAKWRRQFRAAQAVIAEQNRALLRMYLSRRLVDASDFEVYVGESRVVDGSGRIVWPNVDAELERLLAAKPHLAGVEPRPALTALEWFRATQ